MLFDAEIIRSSRRTVAVQITHDGRVVVRAPLWMSGRKIEMFLQSKSGWIEKHLSRPAPQLPLLTEAEIHTLMASAREELPRRVEHLAPLVGVSLNRVTVRCQRTRWGSCSAKGNISLNCLLMLCPEEVRDYVVVHELCHRREMNHSPRFWAEVERVMPDYRRHRQWLKTEGRAIMSRI
ncbi:MAG: M48 family metallopeptidase [Oscillospiraceae bacterium]|nr:M48 family metallopeptidase [Oscillospiraceae bacterium]